MRRDRERGSERGSWAPTVTLESQGNRLNRVELIVLWSTEGDPGSDRVSNNYGPSTFRGVEDTCLGTLICRRGGVS